MVSRGDGEVENSSPYRGRKECSVSWLEEWVSLPAQADNLAKLAASGAEERHLFVFVPAFAEAPLAVADLLLRDDAPSPKPSQACLPRSRTSGRLPPGRAAGACAGPPDLGWKRFDKQMFRGG